MCVRTNVDAPGLSLYKRSRTCSSHPIAYPLTNPHLYVYDRTRLFMIMLMYLGLMFI